MNSEASFSIEMLKLLTGALKDTKIGVNQGEVSRRNSSSFNKSMHRSNIR